MFRKDKFVWDVVVVGVSGFCKCLSGFGEGGDVCWGDVFGV